MLSEFPPACIPQEGVCSTGLPEAPQWTAPAVCSSPPPGVLKWPPPLPSPASLPLTPPPGRGAGSTLRTHANTAISVPSTCLRLTRPGVTPAFPLHVPHRPSTVTLCPQPKEPKPHYEGAWPPLASVSSKSQGAPGPGQRSLLRGSSQHIQNKGLAGERGP